MTGANAAFSDSHFACRVQLKHVESAALLLGHAYVETLLVTDMESVCLDLPNANLPPMYDLRKAAKGDALVVATQKAKRAVVIGASVMGLEVAASRLRPEVQFERTIYANAWTPVSGHKVDMALSPAKEWTS